MIFKQHFIDMILSGGKTQTRRPNRGYYKEGHSYAIQPCRTCKGIPNYRITMDEIWEEDCNVLGLCISIDDAWSEGEYHPLVFEELFRQMYPKWNSRKRWAYKFHVVEVRNDLK